MTALRELRLGYNHIKHLPSRLFGSSTSLERLVLYGNRIEVLARGIFRGLSNLTSLYLQSNRLRLLHPGIFNDTPNLRKLWVNATQRLYIRRAAPIVHASNIYKLRLLLCIERVLCRVYLRQLESNDLSSLPVGSMDAVFAIRQVRLRQNPWYCDCRASYIANWLRRRFASFANLTDPLQIQRALSVTDNWNIWEFGAGAICTGPGALGGQPLLRLTFHELCEGQWASMKGIVPRLPLDVITPSAARKDTILVQISNVIYSFFLITPFSYLLTRFCTIKQENLLRDHKIRC